MEPPVSKEENVTVIRWVFCWRGLQKSSDVTKLALKRLKTFTYGSMQELNLFSVLDNSTFNQGFMADLEMQFSFQPSCCGCRR